MLVDDGGDATHADHPLAARRTSTAGRCATGSSSSRARRWELASTSSPSLDGERARAAHVASGGSARSSRACATRSPPGSCACRSCARPGTTSTTRSRGRSPTSPRSGMRGARTGSASLPAAGMPWFMTVFGRDTIITCLQTLLFGPELARGALEALAELQATEDDPSIDAEPGKIVHEVRRGKAARNWFAALLRHGRRDAALPDPALRGLALDRRRGARARASRSPRCAALEWIDALRRPRRRRVRRVRAAQRRPASRTSPGRTPGTRSASPTGRSPSRRSRRSRCRATSTTRSCRMAELAREVWRDRELAERLEREADELQRRASTRRSGSTSAAATTCSRSTATSGRSTRSARTSATCSGAASSRRRGSTPSSTELMGPDLWSGWGVRTMSAADAGFNPLSYHNGTVWPHDNSLIAWGLARYARWPEAQRIIRRMLERGGPLRLPAAGGLRRLPARRDAVPDRLSDRRAAAGLGGRHSGAAAADAARPRARPRGATRCVSRRRRELPSWAGSAAARPGCARSARSGTCAVEDGHVRVERMSDELRIAVLSPVWFAVPPTGYGGIELGRLAARRRARRRGPRRDAVRLGRLAHEGEARVDLRRGAERADRRDAAGHAPRASPATRARTSSTSSTTTPGSPAAALGGLLETPVVHTVHGPLDSEAGDVYGQIAKVSPRRRR